ncbi:MAG TPA: hypothetical protein VM537_13370 [Anaerolineae bacterium]|nr:hypothetical protein [Anaerolineae bacterium]
MPSEIVTGRQFLLALERAGVLQVEDKTTRVVIDAKVDEALMIYIENFGDERVLEVATHPDLKIAVKVRTA